MEGTPYSWANADVGKVTLDFMEEGSISNSDDRKRLLAELKEHTKRIKEINAEIMSKFVVPLAHQKDVEGLQILQSEVVPDSTLWMVITKIVSNIRQELYRNRREGKMADK
jgi:hypothetical protein